MRNECQWGGFDNTAPSACGLRRPSSAATFISLGFSPCKASLFLYGNRLFALRYIETIDLRGVRKIGYEPLSILTYGMIMKTTFLIPSLSLFLFACDSDKGVTVFNPSPEAEITSHSEGDEVLEG